jgi:hypothetical protein
VSVEPPVPVEVEVSNRHESDPTLIAEIEQEIRAALTFRSRVDLVHEADFGEAGYKTRLVRKA